MSLGYKYKIFIYLKIIVYIYDSATAVSLCLPVYSTIALPFSSYWGSTGFSTDWTAAIGLRNLNINSLALYEKGFSNSLSKASTSSLSWIRGLIFIDNDFNSRHYFNIRKVLDW